jgi:hypothetical protein
MGLTQCTPMAEINPWVIVIPAVATTIITPSVVAMYAFLQHRAQRRQAAADELRIVIDGAAVSLSEALVQCGNLDLLWRSRSLPDAEALRASTAALAEARRARDRLTIRLGEHAALTKAFATADDAVAQVANYLRLGAVSGEELTATKDTELGEILDQAHYRRAGFLRKARTIVGHDLARAGSLS